MKRRERSVNVFSLSLVINRRLDEAKRVRYRHERKENRVGESGARGARRSWRPRGSGELQRQVKKLRNGEEAEDECSGEKERRAREIRKNGTKKTGSVARKLRGGSVR